MFADLAEVMRQLLPAVPAVSQRLAEVSERTLHLPLERLPFWLGLRNVRIRCCLHLRSQGGTRTFFFIPIGEVSARDRLDAVVEFPLAPVPLETASDSGDSRMPEALTLPRSLRWRDDGVLALDFPSGSYVVSPSSLNPKLSDRHRFPKSIGMESWPGGGPLVSGDGKKEAWPLQSLVDFASALAGETTLGGGTKLPWAKLQQGGTGLVGNVWELMHEFAGTVSEARNSLSLLPPVSAPLGMRWDARQVVARLGVLTNETGVIAEPDSGDTFLVPLNLLLSSDTPTLPVEVQVGFPDFVIRDPLRACLADSFSKQRDVQEAARGLGLPVSDLGSVLSEERRAIFLRVDRRRDDDEVLLILKGIVGGVEAAALLHSNRVTYDGLGSPRGPTADVAEIDTMLEASVMSADMGWRSGKQVFCDLLHGLLRWRRMLHLEDS